MESTSDGWIKVPFTARSLLSLFACLLIISESSAARHGDPTIIQEADPNSRFICKGQLGDFPACTCIEQTSEISCINAQFVEADVFLHINGHYKSINKITFHGNNFQDLPDRPLFGTTKYPGLHHLNLSANYIVNLNSNALKSIPNIRVLDLSNNEIVLRPQDTNFLSHTPLLTHLYLRRAFTSSVNRTRQFELMMNLFTNAKLDNLQVLDLSYNYLSSVPYALACPFPSLNKLDLRQNMLKTISMNTTCLSGVNTIDLSRNSFRYLDEAFRQKFANYLNPETLIMRNTFFCDCNSADYIQWIRSTNVIRERNLLVCSRASPQNFIGSRLVEVPVHKLDCETPLVAEAPSTMSGSLISVFLALLLSQVLVAV
uniref:LRRCT domain-containing protein n=1 Tax=Panagrellus redivivus TaxID=6233 RepID=A0A7E4VKQ0_PANRE